MKWFLIFSKCLQPKHKKIKMNKNYKNKFKDIMINGKCKIYKKKQRNLILWYVDESYCVNAKKKTLLY